MKDLFLDGSTTFMRESLEPLITRSALVYMGTEENATLNLFIRYGYDTF